jgi:hypothetical protein
MCRFTKDRLHAEVSSIANRSSPSDNDPELRMCHLPSHMHVHERCRRACRTKGNRMRKGYPMIHARYPELPFLTFAFELESKDPSSILRSSQSVPMESTSLSHDSRYRNPHQVAAIIVPRIVYFLRKEQPSVNRALPPVGWHLCILLASALNVSQRGQ